MASHRPETICALKHPIDFFPYPTWKDRIEDDSVCAFVAPRHEHRPEQFYRKLRTAFLLGVVKAFPDWGRGTAAGQDSGFEQEPVANTVKSPGME